MASLWRKAFTLVELLVVIAIIGLLAGLLLPAIFSAQDTARRTLCLNHIGQAGMAMISHATAKDYFPARLEAIQSDSPANASIHPLRPVSWFAKILPGVERTDIWDAFMLHPDNVRNTYVDVAVCPSDPNPNTSEPWLSYVCNSGTWDLPVNGDVLRYDLPANGISHNLYLPIQRKSAGVRVGPSYITSKDGSTNTILLTENVDAETWYFDQSVLGTPDRPLHSLEQFLGVVWMSADLARDSFTSQHAISQRLSVDGSTVSVLDGKQLFARPSSRHRGGNVNVVMCGGNAKSISPEISYRVYAHLMTPDGMGTIAAFTELKSSGGTQPIPSPSSWLPPLSDGDID